MKREAPLQRSLRKLKHKNLFNKNENDKLSPFGSASASIYNTPKMYKTSSSDLFPKLVSIVSSIGTFNYKLVRFLSHLVLNDYSCKDTFSLVSPSKYANLYRKFLASFNVTSFFTNILVQETIDVAINLIFCHNLNLNITKK